MNAQPQAVVFDLDGTLLDTSAVDAARAAGDWSGVRAGFAHVGEFTPAEGLMTPIQAAQALQAAGVPVGVLTRSPTWYVDELLRRFGLNPAAQITGSDNVAKKPETASLLAIAKLLGRDVDEVVFIGNEAIDHEAAAAAKALAVGVGWSAAPRPEWQRFWPDIALDNADLLRAIGPDLGLLGEVLVGGNQPIWHWGTLASVSSGVWGCGRYFQAADLARAGAPLTQLLLRAKDDRTAGQQAAAIMAEAANAPHWQDDGPTVICSVPPSAGQWDRFEDIRPAVATAFGARDGAALLSMLHEVPGYKGMNKDERQAANQGRWAADQVRDERVLLLDDVYTHGETTSACANALGVAGAATVEILALAVTQEPRAEECPRCGGRLKRRNGPYGPFIGCGNWRPGGVGCDYTRNA